MIVDPPSYFASISEWQDFLKEMLVLVERDFDNDEAHDWVDEARKRIAELSNDSV